jgi:hypothetical protein
VTGMDRIWHVRAALLTVVGALVVHQARYFIAPPEHVHEGAHAYFAWAVPLLLVLAAAAAAELGIRLAGRRSLRAPALPPTGMRFLVFALALFVIFGTQETLEAIFVEGAIPADNPFIVDGAWVSIPLSLAIGGVLALLTGAVVRVIERLGRERSLPAPASPRRIELPGIRVRELAGISTSLAPRGPPLPSS